MTRSRILVLLFSLSVIAMTFILIRVDLAVVEGQVENTNQDQSPPIGVTPTNLPPDLVFATPVPRPEGPGVPTAEGREALMRIPALNTVIGATESRDVDTLLDLLRTDEIPCGGRVADLEACASGAPSIDVVWMDNQIWHTKEMARQFISAVLGDEDPQLVLAVRDSERPVYFIVFRVPETDVLDSFPTPLINHFALAIDSEAPAPILYWGMTAEEAPSPLMWVQGQVAAAKLVLPESTDHWRGLLDETHIPGEE